MPFTILQSFQKFKQNLEITDLQAATVSARQNKIREVGEAGLTVVDSFLTGSYTRNTMIAPLKEADVDVFLVLDPKYFYDYDKALNGGQAGLLDLVKRTLKRTYTRTPDISRTGHAVTIRFEDFVVDVVPGFNRNGGGYLIPDSAARSWLSTDPKTHVKLMSSHNALHAGNLVPLVKMIKAWNRTIDKHFRSFHLEVLAMQIFNNVTISDFPSGARFYFDKGRTVIREQNLDPAGYGDDVGAYINTPQAVQEAVNKFQTAYERAVKAEDLARREYISDAVNTWARIFGDYFPAYG